MAMSKSIAVGSIVTGAIMVVFAAIVVICGAVLANKLTGEITATVGLWSLYVSCKQSRNSETLVNWSYFSAGRTFTP